MTSSRHCCSTDSDVFARRADVTTDGEIRAKRIEAAEPKAGHRAPPMRAPHTPATAVDCYEVYSPSMRVAECPSASCSVPSAKVRPPAWLRVSETPCRLVLSHVSGFAA